MEMMEKTLQVGDVKVIVRPSEDAITVEVDGEWTKLTALEVRELATALMLAATAHEANMVAKELAKISEQNEQRRSLDLEKLVGDLKKQVRPTRSRKKADK